MLGRTEALGVVLAVVGNLNAHSTMSLLFHLLGNNTGRIHKKSSAVIKLFLIAHFLLLLLIAYLHLVFIHS